MHSTRTKLKELMFLRRYDHVIDCNPILTLQEKSMLLCFSP
jgi:hypothetical protein